MNFKLYENNQTILGKKGGRGKLYARVEISVYLHATAIPPLPRSEYRQKTITFVLFLQIFVTFIRKQTPKKFYSIPTNLNSKKLIPENFMFFFLIKMVL